MNEPAGPVRRGFLGQAARVTPAPFRATGYYHFLGHGDYRAGQPLSRWTLGEWEGWFDELKVRGHSRVWVLVNGYTLAYRSRAYPDLIDPFSVAAREPGFLKALVSAGHSRGLSVYAVFTADGHACGMVERRPDLAARTRDGARASDDLMCLEEPEVQAYLSSVFEEVLGETAEWDGVVFHPTESAPERFNAPTRDEFRRETGRDLLKEPDGALRDWFNGRFAGRMRGWIEWWLARIPNLDPVMFNCWWIDGHEADYVSLLPPRTRICVWDYDYRLADWRKRALNGWVRAFGAGRIIFMPSSGGYPDHGRPPGDEPLIGYDRMLTLAAHHGVREAVFFAGWGAGDEEERLIDLGLLRGCTGALAEPSEGLLDALDADWAGVRAQMR